MARRTAALLLLALAAGCATLSSEEDPPAEEPDEAEEVEEEEEALDLRERIVTASGVGGGLNAGDPVSVVLVPSPPVGSRGEVHHPEEARGVTVPASELGPVPGSEGRVTATTLNVRSCPGTECGTVGSLRLGHTVEIHAVEGGWYALDEEETRWASARYIAGAEGWSEVAAEMVLPQFRSFFEEHMAGREPEGEQGEEELFSEWHLGVEEDTLRLTLSSNYNAGPAGQEVCQWAYSSAEILERLAGDLGGYGVSGHHVEVHYRGDAGQPVARSTEDGEITCILR